jgi:hypothetical protein
MSSSSKEIKYFWAKLLLVFAILGVMHLSALLVVDGSYSMSLYKVSGAQRQNLIIGTSRIAQGLMPSVFQEAFHEDFLNLAIDGSTTSYCEEYNQLIFSKLDSTTKDGIFILTLDPWTFTRSYDKKTNMDLFPETESPVYGLWDYNLPLNVQFLIRDCSKGWGDILISSLRNNSTVVGHRDGWVEVTRDQDSTQIELRKQAKLGARKEAMETTRFSLSRLESLHKLITYLDSKGQVYFVRLPVHPEFYELENQFMPNFDQVAARLSERYDIPFMDMQYLAESITFNDGHHINKKHAPLVSNIVRDWIIKEQGAKSN